MAHITQLRPAPCPPGTSRPSGCPASTDDQRDGQPSSFSSTPAAKSTIQLEYTPSDDGGLEESGCWRPTAPAAQRPPPRQRPTPRSAPDPPVRRRLLIGQAINIKSDGALRPDQSPRNVPCLPVP